MIGAGTISFGFIFGWFGVFLGLLLSLPRCFFYPILMVRHNQIWIISALGFKLQIVKRLEIQCIRGRFSPDDTTDSYLHILLKNGQGIDASFLSTSENIAAGLYLQEWLKASQEADTLPEPAQVAGRGILLPPGILRPGYRWLSLAWHVLMLSIGVLMIVILIQSRS